MGRAKRRGTEAAAGEEAPDFGTSFLEGRRGALPLGSAPRIPIGPVRILPGVSKP